MTKATTKPIRIQRKRAKGWRLPPNTVYVGRPTKWGNPFYVGHPNVTKGTWYACDRNQEAKERYALHVYDYFDSSDFHELRGKNLACWCALDQPCHADILLEIANDPTPAQPQQIFTIKPLVWNYDQEQAEL